MMSRLWKTTGNVVFKELNDNLWFVEFLNENDKRRVKDGQPRLFDRSVLVLKEVDENIHQTQMDFTHSLFWLQVHDMPLICMNREVGYQIGTTLGVVEEAEVISDKVGWGCCLQIMVNIGLTKPLDRGRALTLNGKSIWVSFKYEKLAQFCYTCGRIFHALNSCKGRTSFRLNEEESVKQ
jgi:hypothetical protein